MTRRITIVVPVTVLALVMLASLLMMSAALEDSARFGRLFSLLLVLNVLGVVTFLILITANIVNLLKQLRGRQAGSRLTLRMVSLFATLAVLPVLVVFGFSLNFLRHGIDSWFDVRVEQALTDSLELSRTALDLRMRDLLKQTVQMAESLTDRDEPLTPLNLAQLRIPDSTVVSHSTTSESMELNDLRRRSGAEELLLLTSAGKLIASSSAADDIVPNLPSETILLQLRQGRSYIALDPLKDGGLYIRVLVNVPQTGIVRDSRVLQALFPIAARMNGLADNVQAAFAKYTELAYLRNQLKLSFTMSLTLVLLFTILCSVWAAFYSARRLSAPVRDLADGTREVARGNYETTLPVTSRDELGFLVQSFNEMTRRIALARDETRRSRDEAEAQRAYLEAVLGRLSSGVITLDADHKIRTANESVRQILGFLDRSIEGQTLDECYATYPALESFYRAVAPHINMSQPNWQEQVVLFGASGRQVLMCRGTTLLGAGWQRPGHVVVFDDITAMIQGQRNAAWTEAARRLAHEIKNPLTPIKLSAERLRHKYLGNSEISERDALDRLTNTIIQQVETMKGMVDAFSEYARGPRMQPEHVNLNQLIEEVLELYRSVDEGMVLHCKLDANIPIIRADPNRLRQVLNNLIKNALEAGRWPPSLRLEICTKLMQEAHANFVEIRVRDNGRGIPAHMIASVFEPYVTDKAKGTGLGLAIVKKIIEEHGGLVWMENNPEGGACAVIHLPIESGIESEAPCSQLQRDAV
jgi:nitrogen fixation/metabolism regulation signal transduction histidine kinase